MTTPFPKASGCGCKGPGRLTLPVAPHAAARSRFCGEDKLAQAVPLPGALTWLEDLKAKNVPIASLELNGPGDPLSTLPMTLDILTVLRKQEPELRIGITTLGLNLAEHVEELAEHGVSKITLLMDAITPETVEKLYVWIRPGKRNMPLAKAAVTLVEEQANAIAACRDAGISIHIQTSVYTDVNENEVGDIAGCASALGAEAMVLLPGKGWKDKNEKLPLPPAETMARLSKQAARHIKLAYPPEEVGLGEVTCPPTADGAMLLPKATEQRPNVAVLSSSGMDIDLHLGQAIKALIYGPREDGLACLLEARDLPEPGSGDDRWHQLAETLGDCFALLAASAGQRPRQILAQQGLSLILTDDNVEGSVDVLYGGGKKGKKGLK